jgi:single-strand DNA-binding protein
MSYEVKGTINVIKPIQTFDSGFQKREFVITTNEQYPQDIKLEFVKDKCSLLDKFKQGQDVKVSFNLRGSEFNGKYYVNLNAWRIEEGEQDVQPKQGQDELPDFEAPPF